MNYRQKRQEFVDWVRSNLFGQTQDKIILNKISPLDIFYTGILFPVYENHEEIIEEIHDDEYEEELEPSIQQPKRYRYLPPSSVGFSFYITGNNPIIRVNCNAVYYIFNDDRTEEGQFKTFQWEKNRVHHDGEEYNFTPQGPNSMNVLKEKGRIEVLWRPHEGGYIVTVSLINTQKLRKNIHGNRYRKVEQNSKSLFEVELKCIIEKGEIKHYPIKDRHLMNEEEQEIEFRYRNKTILAVGHGAAANWTKKNGKLEIFSDFFPQVEVPQVSADIHVSNTNVLKFNYLNKTDKNDEVILALNSFIEDYHSWIKDQKKQMEILEEKDKIIAERIIKRQICAYQRMKEGLEFLKKDKIAALAFSLANEAMLLQMSSGDKYSGKTIEKNAYQWRPFQLAFILTTLESALNEDSEYRDDVDLIWFPTGGGKTEAYLGLLSIVFIYRRYKFPKSGAGTIAIMRYTLRLLTAQQFIRAARIVFALELIRRNHPKLKEGLPFSIGLWVGGNNTPNNFSIAKKAFKNGDYSVFLLRECPWCGKHFSSENYVATDRDFHFQCNNNDCEFGKTSSYLPCNVVDEALYSSPPSLLLATVDKFAQLVWKPDGHVFFGGDTYRPPELIIQDELHLISGSLGSIVGLYEAGIDTVFRIRGVYPKYIASTATIKNAHEHVRLLFARNMKVFPPPGLSEDDSYFAKSIPLEKKPGRLYIGFLAPMLNRHDCLTPLATLLLTAPIKLFYNQEEFIDCWWTTVVYHGSLKGVGNSKTLYQHIISENFKKLRDKIISEEFQSSRNLNSDYNEIVSLQKMGKNYNPELKEFIQKYNFERPLIIKNLTSHQTAEENAKIFQDLTKPYKKGAIDVVLATNMISVGLDVSRLALMVINGQPLTTAEYIQASSRIGRGNIPGIVFVNYYKTQARSLSHYENFRSYHESFYRFVEPSSLTPFTPQVRDRALHAALIIALRHSGIGMLEQSSANKFNPNSPEIANVIFEFKRRCQAAIGNNPDIYNNTVQHINRIIADWQSFINQSKKLSEELVYHSRDRSKIPILVDYNNVDEGKSHGQWRTLQTMRNVEGTIGVKLLWEKTSRKKKH